MSPHTPDNPLARELEFIEAVSASLSHEINNVFSIIKELSGLVSDFVGAAARGKTIDLDRTQTILQKVEKNVDRGAGYVKRLNRFAHSLDPSYRDQDAAAVVTEIAEICERLARLKKLTLEANMPAAPVRIHTSRFELQHLVFRILTCGFAFSPQGAVLTATVQDGPEGVTIALVGDSPPTAAPEAAEALRSLQSMAQQMGGTVRSDAASGRPLSISVELAARPASH